MSAGTKMNIVELLGEQEGDLPGTPSTELQKFEEVCFADVRVVDQEAIQIGFTCVFVQGDQPQKVDQQQVEPLKQAEQSKQVQLEKPVEEQQSQNQADQSQVEASKPQVQPLKEVKPQLKVESQPFEPEKEGSQQSQEMEPQQQFEPEKLVDEPQKQGDLVGQEEFIGQEHGQGTPRESKEPQQEEPSEVTHDTEGPKPPRPATKVEGGMRVSKPATQPRAMSSNAPVARTSVTTGLSAVQALDIVKEIEQQEMAHQNVLMKAREGYLMGTDTKAYPSVYQPPAVEHAKYMANRNNAQYKDFSMGNFQPPRSGTYH
jgi:hypothetical protein